MILLKTLTWSNLFSYGPSNTIHFDESPITQLVGKNGHGKSSIALVLEETLFNKNSKGIKKADILNRHIKDKTYSSSLTFNKDGIDYEIKSTRGSTQAVQLFKNGENISSHTATATFKVLEDILGFDHKVFTQLVYLSSSSSLEFLTATDTNRKKFLIDLLNLTKYIEAFEVFKNAVKELTEELISVESSISTTSSWLDKHKKENLSPKPIVPVPDIDPKISQEIFDKKAQQLSILETNRRITKNNEYKSHLAKIDLSDVPKDYPPIKDTSPIISAVGEYKKTVKDADALISKIGKLNGTCPTCLQEVDRVKLDELIIEQEELRESANKAIESLNSEIDRINIVKKKVETARKTQAEWESYHSLIDDSIQTDLLDYDDIEKRIKVLEAEVLGIQEKINSITKQNTIATSHNAKIDVIKEQMNSMQDDLNGYSVILKDIEERLSYLQILQKTFSTSGLIAYKIECLIKDLEDLTNEYLADFSGGRFQLTFKVSSSDKLNVVITDNGKDIDILALSGGERARVNTATLLAIRKLMQSLSSARINLLILDETIDSLDVDGKEKLVEILLKEEHLNTMLISHGYTHPLLEKITIVKEHNISRIE